MAKPAFTIEQVRSFLAVADHQNVSRAAGELHLTQGAVTQQVRNFERALGVGLFERSGRGVRLTDAGRSLVPTCRAAMRSFDVVSESALAIKFLQAGSLHVGASPTCAGYYLPPLLAAFSDRYPSVVLNLEIDPTADINEGVRSGVLDCGLIEGEPEADLMNLEVGKDELVLVARPDHPLARAPRLTAAMLGQHRYLGRGRALTSDTTVPEMIGAAYDASQALNLGHPEYVRAAAAAGLGYAVLSVIAVQGDIRAGRLKRLRWPSRERSIHAVRRAAAGGPTLEEFWALVAEQRIITR